MKSGCSRRDFVRFGTGALVSSTMLSSLTGWQRALAASADTTGYKALVCVYLFGGNDGFNWFVPLTQAGYSVYAASRGNLALPQTGTGAPLALTGTGTTSVTASDGYQYGIHPGCTELWSLFNTGKLAVLCNVGTLVTPTTPAQIQAGSAQLPPELFSHIDQQVQWQTSVPNNPARYGWAGRVADLYASQGYTPNLALNIDIGGANYLQQGQQTNMYVLSSFGGPTQSDLGAPILDDTNPSSGFANGAARVQAATAILNAASADPNLMVAQYAAIQQRAAAKQGLVTSALNAAGPLATMFSSYADDNGLGLQLQEVARVIKAQSQLGDARQIFFVSMIGFDTHNDQLSVQGTLLPVLSKNLNTFWAALTELGQTSNVTVFTASDFGRTLGSNGSGADHAWGNHHVIMGGAVAGGQYYGQMPSLQIGGANDFGAGLGQMVPTTSTDQYAATLAAWFGVPVTSLTTLFPNLSNFASATLGFMG